MKTDPSDTSAQHVEISQLGSSDNCLTTLRPDLTPFHAYKGKCKLLRAITVTSPYTGPGTAKVCPESRIAWSGRFGGPHPNSLLEVTKAQTKFVEDFSMNEQAFVSRIRSLCSMETDPRKFREITNQIKNEAEATLEKWVKDFEEGWYPDDSKYPRNIAIQSVSVEEFGNQMPRLESDKQPLVFDEEAYDRELAVLNATDRTVCSEH
ncbi:hypothetical protein I302_101749 [Kwoniella bestiolae CBS 10118]|uniref:Uncharacterized protein n=1 Tax=Kwoniella bestiolae CBS 10118 TaxID=1296100 RepID=A0A1B9GD45_9TREE|nr:hypothetical protein I302_00426 [Kwoniella bestiolae CBS 10118]OCF28936.1 hypothetical protein I302_00426 [Kwoniella bestiolae CBS 10118]